MNFALILITLVSAVATDSQPKTHHCSEGLEYDVLKQTCRPCLDSTEYDVYTRKCLRLSNNGVKCNRGFQYDLSKEKCLDIDECNENKYVCTSSQYCVNEDGGYKCMSKNFCGQGYQLNNVTNECQDINECEHPINNCGNTMVCENVPGSFTCRKPCPSDKKYYWNGGCNVCQEGFRSNRTTNICEDIDECEGPFKLTCSPYKEKCMKMPGLSQCVTQCSGGTKLVDEICYDIDECVKKTHNCTMDKKCVNLFGTYQCESANCENNAIFSSDTNSCVCKSGFRLSQMSGECTDVDECASSSQPCGMYGRCVNSQGSFKCDCFDGFHSQNGTCEDTNECIIMIGICGNLICENTPGKYQCKCSPGFRSNKYDICEDIDECKETPVICDTNHLLFGEKYQCFNLIGSFKCIKSQCPIEYRTIMDTNIIPYETLPVHEPILSRRTLRCELLNPSCSIENNNICLQTLPEKIFLHVLGIPRRVNIPYQITKIKIDIPNYDSYRMQIIFRNVSERGTRIEDPIQLTQDDNGEETSLYLTKSFQMAVAIICDVYLKYSYESQERIHSLNQYHIFINNENS